MKLVVPTQAPEARLELDFHQVRRIWQAARRLERAHATPLTVFWFIKRE
tara:strand:- start:367 stop:513 length:147 start_codon:yes stop_codon:yes gene_type:complete